MDTLANMSLKWYNNLWVRLCSFIGMLYKMDGEAFCVASTRGFFLLLQHQSKVGLVNQLNLAPRSPAIIHFWLIAQANFGQCYYVHSSSLFIIESSCFWFVGLEFLKECAAFNSLSGIVYLGISVNSSTRFIASFFPRLFKIL